MKYILGMKQTQLLENKHLNGLNWRDARERKKKNQSLGSFFGDEIQRLWKKS